MAQPRVLALALLAGLLALPQPLSARDAASPIALAGDQVVLAASTAGSSDDSADPAEDGSVALPAPEGALRWRIQPGSVRSWEASLTCSLTGEDQSARVEIHGGAAPLSAELPPTGGPDRFLTLPLGRLEIDPGAGEITLQRRDGSGSPGLRVQSLTLESGWVDLFDGQTLDGWQLVGGRPPGYVVEGGLLVCPAEGGGNLFTEQEFGDFRFRMEFRLSEGANNGVGIRSPLEGDPAYVGMEIQVLDNESDRYRDRLQPWQYHGSIYGVAPAPRGHLRPTGEWNREEISCQGRRVQVRLNGVLLVDADLDQVKDPEVLAKHPGLQRERGHIGFLGHGTRVEFRRIRLLNLDPPGGE